MTGFRRNSGSCGVESRRRARTHTIPTPLSPEIGGPSGAGPPSLGSADLMRIEEDLYFHGFA